MREEDRSARAVALKAETPSRKVARQIVEDAWGRFLSGKPDYDSIDLGEALIGQFASPTPNNWHPIETAPKDGTKILLCGVLDFDESDYPNDIAKEMRDARPIAIGSYERGSGFRAWADTEVTDERRVQTRERYVYEYWEPDWMTPTHWMPLPSPPFPPDQDLNADQ